MVTTLEMVCTNASGNGAAANSRIDTYRDDRRCWMIRAMMWWVDDDRSVLLWCSWNYADGANSERVCDRDGRLRIEGGNYWP